MDQTERIRRHFDLLGEDEWARLDASPRTRVALEIHRRFLAEHVRPGDRVLEVGAGPGRFTVALAELGARVVVTDLSTVQLELNRAHVAAAGREGAVEDRYVLDIRATSGFADDEFDLVVAYGGPLSYVFEDARPALAGLLRIGQSVIGSVMSTLGSWRFFLPQAVEQSREIGQDANDRILTTGDLRLDGTTDGHTAQMYRYGQLVGLVEEAGGRLTAASASNWLSLGDQAAVDSIASDPDAWSRFVEHEVRACREPGALDGGTHILFAATRAEAPAERT